jgi:membrane protein
MGRRTMPLARYLFRTEVHTYAFSVAANAVLSFFPFMVLLLVLIRKAFHSTTMRLIVEQLLHDYLPTNQDFVIRNIKAIAYSHNRSAWISLFILLITSGGVFLPLEVALNQVWGFPRNRPYWKNLLVSLGLALASGVLALLSIALTAGNKGLIQLLAGRYSFTPDAVTLLFAKVFALISTIAIFFLIYWLLPNGKVPAGAAFSAALYVGLLWEMAKYLYILLLPWLNFPEVYGPFSVTVALIMWAFFSGLLLLAGAYLSAGPEHAPS